MGAQKKIMKIDEKTKTKYKNKLIYIKEQIILTDNAKIEIDNTKLKYEDLILRLLKKRKDSLIIEKNKIITALKVEISIKDISELLKNHIHSQIRLWVWENEKFIIAGFLYAIEEKRLNRTKDILT